MIKYSNTFVTNFAMTVGANYYYDHQLIPEHSEIIIVSENHQAHVTPWVQLARRIKICKIKWWTNGTSNTPSLSSCQLED